MSDEDRVTLVEDGGEHVYRRGNAWTGAKGLSVMAVEGVRPHRTQCRTWVIQAHGQRTARQTCTDMGRMRASA